MMGRRVQQKMNILFVTVGLNFQSLFLLKYLRKLCLC